MRGSVDLHTHTNISDGTMTPEELMAHAMDIGIKIMALTDHDTVSGIERALSVPGVSEYIPIIHGGDSTGRAAVNTGTGIDNRYTPSQPSDVNLRQYEAASSDTALQLIPGLEISTTWLEKDVHILGFFVNRNDPYLLEQLHLIQTRRADRNRKIIELMNNDGIPITEESIPCSLNCVTRAHFAWFLTKMGISRDRDDAFRRYIGNGCKYYLPKSPTSPIDAVKIIQKAGGVPFLAHPMLIRLSDAQRDELISILVDSGLKGIEAYHSSHGRSDVRKSLDLADKYGLYVSSGSDFHAENKPDVYLGMGRGNICCEKLPEILL